MDRTNPIAYEEGMNLYYGAVKYRPQYKWLGVKHCWRICFPNTQLCDFGITRPSSRKSSPRTLVRFDNWYTWTR